MAAKLMCAALVGLTIVIPLAGCGSAAAGPKVVVRDSAGIQIVENGPVRELPAAFVISPESHLDLGGAKDSPEKELDSRAPFLNAKRLSDGRFVVSDMSAIKVFDAAGRYLSTIGRSGNGPGEFRQLRGVCVATGDTIIAIGYAEPRVSVFDREGTHVRTFNVEDGYVEGSGCFDDGSVLIHSSARPNPESTSSSDPARTPRRINTVTHLASDGSVVGVIGDFPSASYSAFIEQMSNTVPHGRYVYAGNGDRPEVRVFARSGKLIRIVRWEQPMSPVTDEIIKEQVAGSVPRNAPKNTLAERLARARAMPRPAAVPAYFRIQVDAAGRIWVEDHPIESASPRPWTVFDSTGRALGRVVPPEIQGTRFTDIPSIGRDEVEVVWRDEENGFAHITFHALTPVRP